MGQIVTGHPKVWLDETSLMAYS